MNNYQILSLIPINDDASNILQEIENLNITNAEDVESAIIEMQRVPYDIIISHQSLNPEDQNKLNKMRLILLPASELYEYYSVNIKHLKEDLQLVIQKLENKKGGRMNIHDNPSFI